MSETGLLGEERIDREWWKEAVFYQIYPRSFNDSTGNGVGDLPGVLKKVKYLDSLGVDALWLCPVYDSPNADNGYDIADYRSIAEEFGGMGGWKALVDELHDRGMRLIMDLVVNHTSEEHEWFQRSRRREGKYGDFYHWRDGSPEKPPNNWQSFFGGPAWSYDDEREQWYLHIFDPNQPDLNWRNPEVRAAITEMVSWWVEKGIDGFRLDAINHLSKTEGFPDGSPESHTTGSEHFTHGPRLREYLRELYDESLAEDGLVTVGEMGGTTAEEATRYLGEDGVGLDMIFLFDHMGVDEGANGGWDVEDWGSWDLQEFTSILTDRQDQLSDLGWDPVFLGNHDLPRAVSRFGDDGEYRGKSASLLATFCMTMPGTPFIYQGEEIGMTNAQFEELSEIDDPATVGKVTELLADDVVSSYEDVKDLVNYRSRDHARTPMQWSSEKNAGFTDGEPWLKLNENYTEINVEAARADPDSVWQQYRELIDLRHEERALVYGEYEDLLEHEQIYAYTRTFGDETVLVVLNWSNKPIELTLSELETEEVTVLYGNYEDTPIYSSDSAFRPYEAAVYRL
jgi:oligo-1,6-glucosidase